MAGSKFEEAWIPTMPDEVRKFLGGNNNLSFVSQLDQSEVGGVAFGVHFSTGIELNVPIVGRGYANFMTGLDIAMLKNVKCFNDGAQVPLGFGDGWYAIGQAYVYANAGVEILGINLIKGEAGILVNAGILNPAFFNGRLAIAAKIGPCPACIKLNTKVDVKLGNEPVCEAEGAIDDLVAEIGEINFVDYITPADETIDVPTNIEEIEIAFISEPRETTELYFLAGGERRELKYRFDIPKIEIISAKTNQVLRTESVVQREIVHRIKQFRALPSNDTIKIKIYYDVSMQLPGSSTWEVLKSDAVYEYSFNTGPVTLRFNPDNLEEVWPIDGMQNLYLEHIDRGVASRRQKGRVVFRDFFPWEIFDDSDLEVRYALYESSSIFPLVDEVVGYESYEDFAGAILFDLSEIEKGKNYKVEVYAMDNNDTKHILMDPIDFRVSFFSSLEEKFSFEHMFYVEASPRHDVTYNAFGACEYYICGFEYNLASSPTAIEGWDAVDAQMILFSPTCRSDRSWAITPSVNEPDFIKCDFDGNNPDCTKIDDGNPIGGIHDVFALTGLANSSFSKGQGSLMRIVTSPHNVSDEEVALTYNNWEGLRFDRREFRLLNCNRTN